MSSEAEVCRQKSVNSPVVMDCASVHERTGSVISIRPGPLLRTLSTKVACLTNTSAAGQIGRGPLQLRCPIEDYLARLAGAHRLETLYVVFDFEVVRNNGCERQPALQQTRHLVPGLKHLAAVDALQRQALENDLIPVDGRFLRRNAQYRHTAA